MRKSVELNGRGVSYELERKNVKNINLRVKPDGIFVSAPQYVPAGAVEDFMRRKATVILSALDRAEAAAREQARPRAWADGEMIPIFGRTVTLRIRQGPTRDSRLLGEELFLSLPRPENPERRRRELDAWLRGELEAVLAALCEKYMPLFVPYGVRAPQIRVRRMKSRWGSCIPTKGIISFNSALAAAPMDCVEYVVVHELTHFLRQDHSPAFYSLLSSFLPDWRQRREKLKKVAPAL